MYIKHNFSRSEGSISIFERIFVSEKVRWNFIFSFWVFEVSNSWANDAAHGEKDTEGSNTHKKSCDIKGVEIWDTNTADHGLKILSDDFTVETSNKTEFGVENGIKSIDQSSGDGLHCSVDWSEITNDSIERSSSSIPSWIDGVHFSNFDSVIIIPDISEITCPCATSTIFRIKYVSFPLSLC